MAQVGQIVHYVLPDGNHRASTSATTQAALGGHLKTGQSWTLQNRPVDRTQNNLVLHYECWVRQVFLDLNLLATCGAVYTDLTWAEGMATQGCDRSADPAAGMAGRRKSPSVTTEAILTKVPAHEARLPRAPMLRAVRCRVVVLSRGDVALLRG